MNSTPEDWYAHCLTASPAMSHLVDEKRCEPTETAALCGATEEPPFAPAQRAAAPPHRALRLVTDTDRIAAAAPAITRPKRQQLVAYARGALLLAAAAVALPTAPWAVAVLAALWLLWAPHLPGEGAASAVSAATDAQPAQRLRLVRAVPGTSR